MLTTKKTDIGYDLLANGQVIAPLEKNINAGDLKTIWGLFEKSEQSVIARTQKQVAAEIVNSINNGYLYK